MYKAILLHKAILSYNIGALVKKGSNIMSRRKLEINNNYIIYEELEASIRTAMTQNFGQECLPCYKHGMESQVSK